MRRCATGFGQSRCTITASHAVQLGLDTAGLHFGVDSHRGLENNGSKDHRTKRCDSEPLACDVHSDNTRLGLPTCCALCCIWRCGSATSPDSVWSKYIKIFEDLGPLVGLAVGWVFGKEVHRKEAENANSRADGAKRDEIPRASAPGSAARTGDSFGYAA